MPRWAWDRNEEPLVGILVWEAHLETRLEYVKRCQRTAKFIVIFYFLPFGALEDEGVGGRTQKRIRELQLEQQQRDLQRSPPQQSSSRPTSNAEPRWIFPNPAQLVETARPPNRESSFTSVVEQPD